MSRIAPDLTSRVGLNRCIIAGACLAFSQLSLAETASTDLQPPTKPDKLQSSAINEASGLATSPTDPDFMWVINDSGGKPEIYLAGIDGADHGRVLLKDAPNIDWEDLASFTLDGKPYLLVADTGDNDAKRDTCVLYVIQEPSLPANSKRLNLTSSPAWQIRFRFEDGPRDCESVTVDLANEKIFLISKRIIPPEVYELPLRAPAKRGILTARKVGTTKVKAPVWSLNPFVNQPTGLDISADGSRAAIVTYYGVFLFPRKPGESWPEALARKGIDLGPHRLRQAESVAFSKNGDSIRVVSEAKNSPIRIYRNISAMLDPEKGERAE